MGSLGWEQLHYANVRVGVRIASGWCQDCQRPASGSSAAGVRIVSDKVRIVTQNVRIVIASADVRIVSGQRQDR